jgi:hypothetical protein
MFLFYIFYIHIVKTYPFLGNLPLPRFYTYNFTK